MSIRYLKRDEIESQKWDDCVLGSPNGQVFFMSWYLDACAPDWSALVDGDYQSVFPMAAKRKIAISYLYQPFFTRHFGLIGHGAFDHEKSQAFLNAIPDRFKYIDFCLHHQHLTTDGFKTAEKTYQILDLNTEEIKAGYSSNLQRVLKKSDRAGLHLVHVGSPEHIVDGFRVNQIQVRDQFKPSDYNRLTDLMHTAMAHTECQCVTVNNSAGQSLGGAFFIGFKDTLLYLKGYSTEDGRKVGAMHFLFDKIIQTNRHRYSTLDFGGSSVPSVARFYRHFGATDCLYLRIQSNRLPKAFRWIKNEQI